MQQYQQILDLDKLIAVTEGDALIALIQLDDDEEGKQKRSVVKMEANETPLNLTAVAADTTNVTAVVVKMEADETSADVASADTGSPHEATTTTSAAAATTTTAATTAVATLVESTVANAATTAMNVDTSQVEPEPFEEGTGVEQPPRQHICIHREFTRYNPFFRLNSREALITIRWLPQNADVVEWLGFAMHDLYRRYQTGTGIGSYLKGLFRGALPLVSGGAKSVGEEAARPSAKIMDDVVNENRTSREVLSKRVRGSRDNLNRKAQIMNKIMTPDEQEGKDVGVPNNKIDLFGYFVDVLNMDRLLLGGVKVRGRLVRSRDSLC
ncbi:hypothetical protein TSAR_006761 [Trichomalopsis sarcophagae]|uniref:Uncharacterized protein n=1 Tax=Trichomalopsis sarcophagae TaxID=543379 RepID=A0A232FMG0_9HYME|nr:hypothetical protein TSAR_006761 [Trichomalopsis sarcophagae]